MRWRDTVRPAEYMTSVPPHVQNTLDVAEGLLPPIETTDRYVYMGRLLDEAKKTGLLTVGEYYVLRECIVGVHGWL